MVFLEKSKPTTIWDFVTLLRHPVCVVTCRASIKNNKHLSYIQGVWKDKIFSKIEDFLLVFNHFLGRIGKLT